MKTLASVWIVSKQPGVLSRRADRLWCGGDTALSHWPLLTGKLIKCLIMSSPCSCSAEGLLAVGKGSLGRSSAWLTLPMALLWKILPSGLRLISSGTISSKMCLCPHQRHIHAGWPSGDMCQHRDFLLMCLHTLSCGWGKEMDGKVSVISMGNRAMPGRWSVIF